MLRTLKRLGFVFEREGSRHTIYKDPADPDRLIAIPRHARVKRDLLRGVLSGVGITEEEFMERY